MGSYGKIYCSAAIGYKVIEYFSNIYGGNEKEELLNRTYNNAISSLTQIQKREPNQFERDSTYRAAKEYVNTLLEKPKARSTKHLLEITHSLLSIENTFSITKKISQLYKNVTFCSVSNFDESAFQLSIIENGTPLTIHQVGDELLEMDLKAKCGDADIIASFFNISLSIATEFIRIYDPIDAEDLFFHAIVL